MSRDRHNHKPNVSDRTQIYHKSIAIQPILTIFAIMSHISLTYHLIFGTYKRRPVIHIPHERELYKFAYDFSTDRGIKIWRIGGMPDHIHILCDIPAKIAVADYVKLLKTETSKFMRFNPHFPYWEKWAEGYGAFTVDTDSRNERIRYIIEQKTHHKVVSFQEEYRRILSLRGFGEDVEILGE